MQTQEIMRLGEAWLTWCQDNPDKLPLPIEGANRDGEEFEIRLAGAHPDLRSRATEDALFILLFRDGAELGGLSECEVSPERDANGRWFCLRCKDDANGHGTGMPATFETLLDLWADHLFEGWASAARRIFQADAWIVLDIDEDFIACTLMKERRFRCRKPAYHAAFATVENPRALNPRCPPPDDDGKEILAGFAQLGPSITGIGFGSGEQVKG